MEATARFALCIALTNSPQKEDWKTIFKLAKILTKNWNKKQQRCLFNLLNSEEIFNIPCALKLISLDTSEWKHLMNCISQNDMGGNSTGNQNDEEIHVQKEHWWMGPLENIGLEALCLRQNNKNH